MTSIKCLMLVVKIHLVISYLSVVYCIYTWSILHWVPQFYFGFKRVPWDRKVWERLFYNKCWVNLTVPCTNISTLIIIPYSIPCKSAALVPEFAVEELPSAELQPRFLCLQCRTRHWLELWWWWYDESYHLIGLGEAGRAPNPFYWTLEH